MKVLSVSFIIILIDQISKFLIKGFSIPSLNINVKGVFPYTAVSVLGNFLEFTNIENTGIAFGWFFGIRFKALTTVLTLITVIALIIYLYKIKNSNFKYRLGIAMVIGGALGNLVDRIFYGLIYGYAPLLYGRVIDFIQIRFFEISLFGRSYSHLPIFNIADIGITIGVIFMVLFYKKADFTAEQIAEAGLTVPETEIKGDQQINNNEKENN
jgi:signal peptidase II